MESAQLALLRATLPARVGIGLRRTDDEGVLLFPEEAQLLGPDAVLKRRRDFAAGRAAARDALQDLGGPAGPIGRSPDGAPVWPAGVVGAISHAAGYGLSLVGWSREYLGLGVDFEDRQREASESVARYVCLPSELEWISEADPLLPANLRRLLLFSAKETIFKLCYPLQRVWLDFGDAELRWLPDERAFLATLRKRVADAVPAGFILRVHALVLSDVVLTFAGVPTTAGGTTW
ncbi:MAG: hypothetical protein QOF51_3839 [Chloroflexota bacterium]|nr:hypothetical protein [Chloroflexota bacterium]